MVEAAAELAVVVAIKGVVVAAARDVSGTVSVENVLPSELTSTCCTTETVWITSVTAVVEATSVAVACRLCF